MPNIESKNPNGFTNKKLSDPVLDEETKQQIAPSYTPPWQAGKTTGDKPVLSEIPGESLLPKDSTPGTGFFSKNKLYIALASLGVVIVGVVLFLIFRSTPAPKEANIQMDIEVPNDIATNSESIFKITIANKDTETLLKPELEVVYPEGVRFIDSTPKAVTITGTGFVLGDIAPGQSPTIFVKVRPEGGVGDSLSLVVKLRYRYQSFNSEFVKQTEKKFALVASGVALNLEGPNITNNAQVISYTLTYVNNAEFEFKNARVQFTYPVGFVFGSSEPAPNVGKNIWNLPQVPKGFKGTIVISGTYKSAAPGESQKVIAEFQSQDTAGGFRKQADINFVTTIETQPLLVSQELGERSGSLIVKPGDHLTYHIHYQNNATVAAHGVNIVATITSRAINQSSIQAEGAQISGNTITWNAASMSNLESVNPSEGGDLEFTFEVKNPPVKDNSTNIDIKTAVKIKSNEYDAFLPGNELLAKVESLASVSTGLEYIRGELPPKVGKDTTYEITLVVKNLTNAFNNCLVTGLLALSPASFMAGSVSPSLEASRTTFDVKTGKLTWNVGQLKAHTGDLNLPRTVSFNVTLNPAASQVGSSVTLFKGLQMACTDSFTEQEVKLQGEDITTDQLPGEDSGNGRVEN